MQSRPVPRQERRRRRLLVHLGNFVLCSLEARVDHGARLVRAGVVDLAAVCDIGGKFREGEVGGQEEEEGEDDMEGEMHGWFGGRCGRRRSRVVSK